jgi:hypothetical protein
VDDLETVIRAAFAQVDVAVVQPSAFSGDPDPEVDLVVDPDGAALQLWLKRVAFVNDPLADRLALEGQGRGRSTAQTGVSTVLFVVADQVTRSARRVLTHSGVGYLDLRGHLGLHAPGLIIEADVDPQERRAQRRDPLIGKVGREVAAALLMDPDRRPGVRGLARELNRSVSTVSEALSSLREGRYVDEGTVVSGTRLFWALADHWSSDAEYLLEAPPLGRSELTAPLRFEFDEVGAGPGWALRGTAAAAVLGAPVAVRADQPLDFFVPDTTIVNRARRLLRPAPSADLARCSVAVAPVPAACTARIEPPGNYFEWPTTHPLFIALDLAQDAGRGQEILRDWTPKGWPRVW